MRVPSRIPPQRYLLLFVIPIAIYLLLQVTAIARLLIAHFDEHATDWVEGSFGTKRVSRRQGELIVISSASGQWILSCEKPGIQEYVGCFPAPRSLTGKTVKVEWITSPAGPISGSTRRPLRIETTSGDLVWKEPNPTDWFLRGAGEKTVFVAIASAFFFGLYALLRRVLSIKQTGRN